jgi:hypothetical protein
MPTSPPSATPLAVEVSSAPTKGWRIHARSILHGLNALFRVVLHAVNDTLTA